VRDMPCRLTAVPPGAHAGAGPRPPVHGKLREHCVPTGMTRRLPLGRRHAAVAHTRAGALPSATGRSSAARLQPPCRPCHGSCWHDARAKLLATPLAYNPPPPRVSALRAPESTPPVVVSLLFCLLSGPTEPLVPFQTSTRASPITYGLASPSHSPGTSPPRRRRGCLAAGHHRVVPRPSL
jgi:hypothetical protein